MVSEKVEKKFKLSLIGGNFDKSAGQGIEKYCAYLAESVSERGISLDKIKLGLSNNSIKTIWNSVFSSFFKTILKKSDIYHFVLPDMAWPCLFKKPSIVTIYDVIPYVLTKERKSSYNLYFRTMLNISKHADHIIVISKSTKEDIMKYLNVPEKKITLIYLGVDQKIFFKKKTKNNDVFTVGFLGGLVKRKNAKIILKVAEILKGEKIIFKIGGRGFGFEDLVKEARDRSLDNVKFMGFVPDDELNDFYNSLDLFVAPTIYDGFCMPGLEAMSAGCPIITSNISALPEVAGNAGIKIDPNNASEISNAVLKVKNNLALQKRMSEESIKHAKKFTWEKCVNETLDLYEQVLKNSH